LPHSFDALAPNYLVVIAVVVNPTQKILYMVYQILSAKDGTFRLEYAPSNLDDFETNIHDDP